MLPVEFIISWSENFAGNIKVNANFLASFFACDCFLIMLFIILDVEGFLLKLEPRFPWMGDSNI